MLKTQAHPNGEGELMPSTDEPEDGCLQTEFKCFLSGIPHSMPSYHAVINPKCYVSNKLDCRICIGCKWYVNHVQIIRRRYMAEILPLLRKTLFNQSINPIMWHASNFLQRASHTLIISNCTGYLIVALSWYVYLKTSKAIST